MVGHLLRMQEELRDVSKQLGRFWGFIFLREWRKWPRLGAVTCTVCGRRWSGPHGLDLASDPRCCGGPERLRWDRVRKLASGWTGAANG